MLKHYTLRLSYFVSELRQSLNKYNSWVVDHTEVTPRLTARTDSKHIKELMALLAAARPKDESESWVSSLVLKAWAIRQSQGALEFLQSSSATSNSGYRLWLDICFLGRLREAYVAFLKIATALPCFANVKIHCIPALKKKYQKKDARVSVPLSLKQTFQTLGLSLNDATVKTAVGRKHNIGTATKLFDELQNHQGRMHAEMQMILYMNRTGQTDDVMFSHIGCSKRSCFLCHSFLQAYGTITTRGCHGKLYNRWAIPCTSEVAEDAAKRIDKALKATLNAVARQILLPVKLQSQHIAESSIGDLETRNESELLSGTLANECKLSQRESDLRKTESHLG